MELVISHIPPEPRQMDFRNTSIGTQPTLPSDCYANFILLKGEYDGYL